ncbi:alpha/beta fold hydrolase [Albimonas pacifica]|uniref:Pimeloyl-ACP methyl ester carboxylesterase n=1 Tax=Albimonas pacifica TaxID=1114924 RepID=A0A1I3FIA9_9RHOB|nr:alpha/beta hydrolase [Albimonas pacifica]SFI10916.1 Pimeloyl-ACP methyl ester carboxylesterase [Albimonas pacifica]
MVKVESFDAPDGTRLGFIDEGPREGPLPVLCLPGLTRNHADFAAVAERLSPSRRVIRLDSRGRGVSDHADPATYDLPTETADAVALLDHLGIEKAVFVGTSRGGMITMLAAVTAPGRIAAAVLNDIGPEIDQAGLDRIKGYVGKAPAARTLDELAVALEADGRAGAPTLTRADWTRIAEAVAEETPDGVAFKYDLRLGEAMAAQNAALEARLAEGGAAPDLWPLFQALAQVPVLVLRGANSDILSAETAAKMAAVSPNVTLVTVPDRAHVPLLDEPECVEAIDALLAKAG